MMNTKSIIIFIRSLAKGGAEKQSLLLTKYLSQFFPVYLVVFHRNSKVNHIIPQDLKIIYLDGNLFFKILKFFSILKKKNITHIFNYLPSNNIIGLFVGKIAGVKNLYGGIRGVKYKSFIKMQLTKYLCNNISSGFISNSYAAALKYIDYGFKQNKIEIIHNAIEEVIIKRTPHKKLLILSVGRFTDEKDYFTAIKSVNHLFSYSAILKEIISFRIIGYGEIDKSITEIINQNKLEGIIEIITDGNIKDNYSHADILLNTSIYEGMPNVIMEAMNYGLPIVATDAGDTRYLVKDSENGYLCNIGDYKDIAEMLYKLINDEQLRNNMGKNSRKIIDETFRPEKIFLNYKELILGNK